MFSIMPPAQTTYKLNHKIVCIQRKKQTIFQTIQEKINTNYMNPNFRGVKKVIMVNVIEGNGKTTPFREVHYIFDLDQHGGTHGGLVGKIDAHENNTLAYQAQSNTAGE
jgi:hypothetical protein